MKLFSFFNKKNTRQPYMCSCCGQVYEELPLCFGTDYPDYYFSIPPEEREQRIDYAESLCVIDNQHFFHRGTFTIPIIDHTENLIFNVWTTIRAENFHKRIDLLEDANRIHQEPYFGWLQTTIPTYGNTLHIQTIALEQKVGLIPKIKSIEKGHRLTIDQENGILYKKAVEIVAKLLQEQHQAHQ